MRQYFYYFLVVGTLGMSEMWVSLKRIEVSDYSRGVAKDRPFRAKAHQNVGCN